MNLHRITVQKILAVSLSIWTTSAAAQNIVKVRSAICATPDRGLTSVMEGSGLLLQRDGEQFVLTSSHVIYPSSFYCHSFEAEAIAGELDFVSANFANGLALLKVKKQLSTGDFYQWDDLRTVAATLSQDGSAHPSSASLNGYRFKNMTRLQLEQQLIRSWNSRGVILPLAQSLIEIEGPTEFGMSGGGAFAMFGDRLAYIGMLSHHYYTLQVGAPPILQTRVSGAQPGFFSNLIIPTPTIVAWLEQVWSRDPRALLVNDSIAQQTNEFALNIGALRLVERDCRSASSERGVGGGEGGDRGGGEGVGVGGAQSNIRVSACHLEIGLAPSSAVVAPGFKSIPAWDTRIAPELAKIEARLQHEPSATLYVSEIVTPQGLRAVSSINVALSLLSQTADARLDVISAAEFSAKFEKHKQSTLAACKRVISGRAASVEGGCLDQESQLVWSAVSLFPKAGNEAESVCESYSLGGRGWRLPTVSELSELAQSGFAERHLSVEVDSDYWAIAEKGGIQSRIEQNSVTEVQCSRRFVNLYDERVGSLPVQSVNVAGGAARKSPLNPSLKKNVLCVRSTTNAGESSSLLRALKEAQSLATYCDL